MSQTRYEYRCAECGSTNVRWDSFAVWNADQQAFVLGDEIWEEGNCRDCLEEFYPDDCPPVRAEIVEGETKRIRCNGCGIPIPEPPVDADWEERLCDTCLPKEGEAA